MSYIWTRANVETLNAGLDSGKPLKEIADLIRCPLAEVERRVRISAAIQYENRIPLADVCSRYQVDQKSVLKVWDERRRAMERLVERQNPGWGSKHTVVYEHLPDGLKCWVY